MHKYAYIPEAAGELAGMERVNDSPRPTTATETAPKRDPTVFYFLGLRDYRLR